MRDHIWINKSKSFEEALQFDDSYYLSMSAEERLETIQFLREEYFRFSKESRHEGRKRLQRILKVIKQS
jgi:hypothetical protein